MPGPRLPPGPMLPGPPTSLAYESTGKQRVHLSILKSEHLDQIPGELFSSVSAGFGRFDCEKLLKPSGVELCNLPKTANIELSVHRRPLPGAAEPGKQLPIYRGYISLAQVRSMTSISGDGAANANLDAAVFEDWLGLLAGDMPLPSQSHDHLFLHCLDMGKQNSLRPKLLIRLQSVASGVPLVAATRVERPSPQVRTASQVQTPPAVPQQAFAAVTSQGGQISELEALRQRVRALEKENDDLRADRSMRELAEKDVANQVSQLVQQLGIVPTTGANGHQAPIAQVSACLQEVTAKVAELTSQEGSGTTKAALGSSFYKPLMSDPVDCLVAATLLRLDCPTSDQLVRLSPGHYQLGEPGRRLYCRIDNGRLLTQPEDPLPGQADGQLPPPMEFSKFITEMIAGTRATSEWDAE